MEVAVGERGQDVDPEDGDFLVSWLFFLLGLFSVPLGRFFLDIFPKIFEFLLDFGSFFWSQKWTQKWASDSGF